MPQRPGRVSAVYGSVLGEGDALQALRALEAAEHRAEAVLAKLESSTAQAEKQVAQAIEVAERTLAVAAELRDDVSSLISALQGLATEVDAQMRDHTANLMVGLSARERRSEAAEPSEPRQSLHGATAAAAELDEKAAELRQLVKEAGTTHTRLGRALGDQAQRVPLEPVPFRGQAHEAMAALDERAQAVQDEVSLNQMGNGTTGVRYARAMELAAQGLDPDEVARACGLGREEVRMLLRLRSRDAR